MNIATQLYNYSVANPHKIALYLADNTICTYSQLLLKILSYVPALTSYKIAKDHLFYVDLNDEYFGIDLIYACLLTQRPFISGYSIGDTLEWCINNHLKLVNLTKQNLISSFDIDSLSTYDPELSACIYLTSGTTSGIRKGVVHTFSNIYHSTLSIINNSCISSDHIEMIASPADNAFWFGRLRSVFFAGGSVALLNKPINPLKILSSISSKVLNINALSGDTPIFNMLFIDIRSTRQICMSSSLKYLMMSSMKPSQKLVDTIIDIHTIKKFYVGYGLTEAMRLSYNDLKFSGDSSHAGKILPEWSIKIINGEICVKGCILAKTYLNSDHKWLLKLIDDGFFKTGDLGYFDSNDNLVVIGRTDDVINVGGKSVDPRDIENFFLNEFSIRLYICSINSSTYGHELVAVVPNQKSYDESKTIISKLQQTSNSLPIPHRIMIIDFDLVPLTDNGKLKRQALNLLVSSYSEP